MSHPGTIHFARSLPAPECAADAVKLLAAESCYSRPSIQRLRLLTRLIKFFTQMEATAAQNEKNRIAQERLTVMKEESARRYSVSGLRDFNENRRLQARVAELEKALAEKAADGVTVAC